MSETQQLRPLILSELSPPMNITLVQDGSGLEKLARYVARVGGSALPITGLDTETNFVHDFWFRRVRTVQIGDKDEQFVIDMLTFAGSEEKLIESQGYYGVHNRNLYKPVFDILTPVLCSAKFLKVGQNLSYEYEVLNWNFGQRIWHLYSTDLAERVIHAGRIAFKKYKEFSMQAISARYFKVLINKDEQKTFDLYSPLTQEQVEYAAFDIRMPLAIRQAQMKILTADGLLATVQIENDCIGAYTDMHLNGQRLDSERWLKRIEATKERRIEEIKFLDKEFIPVVGNKSTAIDYNKLDRLEKIWKENFETPTADEMATAAAVRLEKDKDKKEALRTVLKNQKQLRAQKKAGARAEFSALSKERTSSLKTIEKCEGEAFLNYSSNQQLLSALQHFPGMKHLESVGDEVLIKFNDKPLIQVLRRYRKNSKDIGTYGAQWTQQWITKPCKAEGWLHPGDGRLHCYFSQLEAETGRSSSSKPNAQNLPAETEVRECFIADPPDASSPEGYKIITVDLEGCELRIIAELAQAQSWLKAFALGQDLHSVCTEILYPEKWATESLPNCTYYEKNEHGEPKRKGCECPEHIKLRKGTKATNFMLVYGGGPQALADAIGSSLDTAKDLMKLHESKFPDIWSYLYRSGQRAKETKEARSMYGRRRLFLEPTYALAREWVIANEDEKLELSEEECEAALFTFKAKELREPKEEEKWSLTHRAPTEREIKHGMMAMMGSIDRRGKNHPAQSTNADLVKRAMGCGTSADGKPYLWHVLPKYSAKLLSMVHDELVFQSPARYDEQVAKEVKEAFLRAGAEVCKSVAMTSKANIADHWEK